MPRKKKPAVPLGTWHVEDPPSTEPLFLCQRHYEGWRDGPRTGPAFVIDLQDTSTEPCFVCSAEAFSQ